MNPTPAIAYARSRRPVFISELAEFLRFASVSSDPSRTADVKACAHWLARQLKRIGLRNVRLISTKGHPLVYGSWLADPSAPTLLLYGHYDVVPPEPLKEWQNAPFTPLVRNGKIFARGASDDKGQLFCHVKALECLLRANRALPCNVKCLFEGEEEIGSRNLLPFLERHKAALHADAAVISDTRMRGPGQPAISYAQRGGLRAELTVRGPAQELHSGTFGGTVLNPIQALCDILAALHDKSGRVAIPGFYDDVREWSEDERRYMAKVGLSDRKILEEARVKQGWGEPGYSAYERTTTRPALTLNGILGGYTAAGVKGVIPAEATAKLSFRLVPNQDPEKIARLFRKHVAKLCPEAVECTVRTDAPTTPVVMDRKHPAVVSAAAAYKRVFGRAPVFLRSGGSVPVASALQQGLGIPVILMGFGLPDDRIHAPNEKFDLSNFHRGIETSIRYMALAAKNLRHARPHRHARMPELVP